MVDDDDGGGGGGVKCTYTLNFGVEPPWWLSSVLLRFLSQVRKRGDHPGHGTQAVIILSDNRATGIPVC
ncbi:hypothetical protein CFE70_006966 [Pyrenophora teres f. teres 0-1]